MVALDTSNGDLLQAYPVDSADAAALINPGLAVKAYQSGRNLSFTESNLSGQILRQGSVTLSNVPAGTLMTLREILPSPNGLIAHLQVRDTTHPASYPIFIGLNASFNQIVWRHDLNLVPWRYFRVQTVKTDVAGRLYALLKPSNYGSEYGNPSFLLQLDSTGQFQNYSSVGFVSTPEVTAHRLNLYPLPAQGALHIRMPAIPEGTQPYRLHGLTGQMYQRGQLRFSGGEATLDLNELAPGTYFLLLEAGEKRYRARVLVE
jgi:hypothetical protein